MFERSAHDADINWTKVDQKFVDILWRMYRSDPTITACKNLIINKLLGLGVMYVSAEKETLPSKEFYTHVQKKYVSFCKEFLENIIVQGYCAFCVVTEDSRGKKLPYPVVVPPELSYVEFGYDKKFRKKIKCETLREEDDLKIFVYVNDFPSCAGIVTSQMASIWRSHAFTSAIEQNMNYADSVRAKPPVLTKNKTDHTFDTRDVISGAVPGLQAQNASENMMMRNMINMEQFKQQEKLIQTLNAQRIDTSSVFWQSKIDPMTGLPVFDAGAPSCYVPSFVPMPNDAEPAPFVLPESRKDVHVFQNHYVNQVCLVMGVPLGTISGGSAIANNNRIAQLSDNILRFTLIKYRSILTDVLLDVYKLCFQPLAMKITDGHLEEPRLVGVVFPSFQRPDHMRTLYTDGILTYEAYKNFLKPYFDLENKDIKKNSGDVVFNEKQRNLALGEKHNLIED